MRLRLIITPQADRDVDEQFDYLAGENIEAATRFFHAIFETFNALLATPYMGRLRFPQHSELDNLRVWFVQDFEKHLIFYRVLPDAVEIVRVLHGARDIESVLTEDHEA
jgi:toxin ParE1/3/4